MRAGDSGGRLGFALPVQPTTLRWPSPMAAVEGVGRAELPGGEGWSHAISVPLDEELVPSGLRDGDHRGVFEPPFDGDRVELLTDVA